MVNIKIWINIQVESDSITLIIIHNVLIAMSKWQKWENFIKNRMIWYNSWLSNSNNQ